MSIFACTHLDTNKTQFTGNNLSELANLKGALIANSPDGYWDQDTHYTCMAGTHRWLFGLGIIWVVCFCVGFPVAMAVVLYRNRDRLEDTTVGGCGAARRRGAGRGAVRRLWVVVPGAGGL